MRPFSLLRVADVAERLGLSASKVYQLVSEKKISHRRIGRIIRFDEVDLEEYREAIKCGRRAAETWSSKTEPREKQQAVRSKDWF